MTPQCSLFVGIVGILATNPVCVAASAEADLVVLHSTAHDTNGSPLANGNGLGSHLFAGQNGGFLPAAA